MILEINDIINFYDSKNPNDSGLVSSLTGLFGEELVIALLAHFLATQGSQIIIHDEKPRSNRWLDAWISSENNGITKLFQVEVKNWSSHSLGGVKLLPNASNEDVNSYGLCRLKEHYDFSTQELSKDVEKVLIPMKNEPQIKYQKKETTLAFWMVVSDNLCPHELNPYFGLNVKSDDFQKINIFSASIYLRQLLFSQQTLKIELPKATERINKLHNLIHGES
jgi:hypothetical protein